MSDIQMVPEPEVTGTDLLIRMAIDKNIDLQKLEKLIELRNAEETRQAKREFDQHFAEMQSEYLPAQKTSEAKDANGKLLYKYCPLENILKVYQPIMSRHGFSYCWDQTESEKGMTVICIISGWGWERRHPIPVSIMPGGKMTNDNQEMGIALSYGKRYSFCNALGIIIEEEDTDARVKKGKRELSPEQKGILASMKTLKDGGKLSQVEIDQMKVITKQALQKNDTAKLQKTLNYFKEISELKVPNEGN